MEYISTRNKEKTYSFSDVFLKGLAPDGGLFQVLMGHYTDGIVLEELRMGLPTQMVHNTVDMAFGIIILIIGLIRVGAGVM